MFSHTNKHQLCYAGKEKQSRAGFLSVSSANPKTLRHSSGERVQRERAFTHNSTALLYVCIIAQGTQGTNFFFTRVTESRIKGVNELLCTQLVHNLTVQTVPIVMRERHMQVLSSILCKVATERDPKKRHYTLVGYEKKKIQYAESSQDRENLWGRLLRVNESTQNARARWARGRTEGA